MIEFTGSAPTSYENMQSSQLREDLIRAYWCENDYVGWKPHGDRKPRLSASQLRNGVPKPEVERRHQALLIGTKPRHEEKTSAC